MAKVKIKAGNRPRGSSSSMPAPPPKPPTNPVVMIIALIGWIIAGVALYASFSANSRQAAALQAIEDSLPQAMEEMQREVNAKTAAFTTSGQQTATKIEEKNTAISDLFTEVQELQQEGEKLVEERKALEETLAETEKKLTEKQAELDATSARLTEVNAQVLKLAEKKDKMKNFYRKRYSALESKLRELVDTGSGNQLKHFHNTYHHTPFGPAAGFYAGDKLYKARATGDARKVFERIAKMYPDTMYASAASSRIQDIAARVPYADTDTAPGIRAYNALQFAD